mgnify:CR=1 FL=1
MKATFEEIKTTLSKLESEYPSFVDVEVIGRSAEERDILMACVTDKGIPNDGKEIVLIAAGHHAEEHGGRWAALALLRWLMTDDAAEIRKKQVVLIIPFVNVDHVAGWPALYDDYDSEKGPSNPQAKAVWGVVEDYRPDVVVDSHAYGGYTNESTLTHPINETSWDAYIQEVMAQEMNCAAQKEGYPVDPSTWSLSSYKSLPNASYNRFHSLSFLTEVNQDTYDEEDTTNSGLARLRELLKFGNTRWWGENQPGYPNRIIAKVDNVQLVAYGNTAEERRKNRVELWNRRRGITLKEVWPVERKCISAFAENTTGAALRFKLPRAVNVKEASVNGHVVQPFSKGGYVTWQEPLSTYVEMDVSRLHMCVSTVKFDS